jgi:hypothetical protein
MMIRVENRLENIDGWMIFVSSHQHTRIPLFSVESMSRSQCDTWYFDSSVLVSVLRSVMLGGHVIFIFVSPLDSMVNPV